MMGTKSIGLLVVLGTFTAAGSAAAKTSLETPDAGFSSTTTTTVEKHDRLADRMKRVEVFGGLGGGNFTQDLGDFTDSGLAWSGRLGVQPSKYLGLEVAYGGLNTSTNASLIQGDLQQHQFTVDAKPGVPIDLRGHTLRPYVLAGVGYSRLNADSSLGAIGIQDDNLLAVPLGAGVSYDLAGPFAVDGRFTYNILNGVDQPLAGSADSWTALVNLGAQFGGR